MHKPLDLALAKAVSSVIAEQITTLRAEFDTERKALQDKIFELETQIASIPAGEKGEKGVDGKDGRDGIDGKDSEPLSIDDIQPVIDLAVSAAVSALPAAKDGIDGINGKDGIDGANGKDGRDGIDGKNGADGLNGKDGRDGIDGKSITVDDIREALEAQVAKWALDFERRAQDLIQRTLDKIPTPKDGKDGRDGKDGADGLSFDEFELVQDGPRLAEWVGRRGDIEKKYPLRLPGFDYREIWKSGERYTIGDSVTFGGSLWIAIKDDPKGKPGEAEGWKLAVKRGRDGKDGINGAKGEKGDPGPRGKDLTQIAPDGSRF